MSPGVMLPSESGVPARTASCSCTSICFDRDTRYLRCSPVLEVTIISRFPRFTLPIVTSPSISDTTAGFDGLRASKSSVTRGRPPVISPALPTERGILTSVVPVATFCPSSTTTLPPTGRLYVPTISPFSSTISQVGTFVLSFDSVIIRSVSPVVSSVSEWKVTPSITSRNFNVPAYSVTITALNGSHFAITVPLATLSPCL